MAGAAPATPATTPHRHLTSLTPVLFGVIVCNRPRQRNAISVEELSCLGEWKEGSVRYLVGRLDHRSAKTDEDKFRCFVFEKSRTVPGGVAIAQSVDATCEGLSSSIEGSRTMRLEPSDAVQASCTFPRFLTQPQNWRTLDGSEVFRFHQNSTFSVHNTSTGQVYTTVTCVRDVPQPPSQPFQQFAVHVVSGW